jgi:hypothetical protein
VLRNPYFWRVLRRLAALTTVVVLYIWIGTKVYQYSFINECSRPYQQITGAETPCYYEADMINVWMNTTIIMIFVGVIMGIATVMLKVATEYIFGRKAGTGSCTNSRCGCRNHVRDSHKDAYAATAALVLVAAVLGVIMQALIS